MKKLFSERYKDLLENSAFITEFPDDLKRKLVSYFKSFDEPSKKPISRYDGYMVDSSAEHETLELYWEMHGWNQDSIKLVDEEWFFRRDTYELFDIIEIWCTVLSSGEKSPFQKEFNALMEQYEMPWLLSDGKIIKIDALQFEQELRNKVLKEMEKFSEVIPEFRNAFLEFLEACDKFANKDFNYTILSACKSYESVLKVVLNDNSSTADMLTKAFINSEYMSKLPFGVNKIGFQEKVLTALPFLRNKIAGHGNGEETYEVTEPLARLSVNLASSLNTYIMEQYKVYNAIGQAETIEIKEPDDSEIPF